MSLLKSAVGVSPPELRPRRRLSWKSPATVALLFALPYLVLFLVFRIIPAIGGMLLSLTDYGVGGEISFVGFEKYSKLFGDGLFWNALGVTALYVIITVPLILVISLAMAQLSMRSIRGIGAYRAAYFLPVITSLVTSAVIWQWIYSERGPLNWLFGLIGLGPFPWISSDALVIPALAMVGIWGRFGYDLLILLAGLLAIPKEYYEAAVMDGASKWKQFRYVSLPQLKKPIFFVLILELVSSIQVFDVIYVMTGGGPVRSSYSLVFFIYDQGFRFFDFGYASAAGVVLFAITLTIALIQRRVFREDED